MIINNPAIVHDQNFLKLISNVEFKGITKDIFFSVDNTYSELITDHLDPFLIGMLVPAMYYKEDIVVKGKISKRLLKNLEGPVQDILTIVIPKLKKIKIHATNIIEDELYNTPKLNTITGFSAGIDAFTTLDDYFLNPISKEKITHFIFNNLTFSHKRINYKVANIKKIIEKYNLLFFQTYSNLHFFYHKIPGIGFEQTHTIRNAAIPHFLGGVPSKFLYSSTFHSDMTEIKQFPDIAIVDTILLPLLSSNRVECKSVGSEYTRVEKTLKVAHMPDSYLHLDTCIGPFKVNKRNFLNCGTCRKCKRALLTFELENLETKFAQSFDLNSWYNIRENYIQGLNKHTQQNDKELYHIIEKNYPYILEVAK